MSRSSWKPNSKYHENTTMNYEHLLEYKLSTATGMQHFHILRSETERTGCHA